MRDRRIFFVILVQTAAAVILRSFTIALRNTGADPFDS